MQSKVRYECDGYICSVYGIECECYVYAEGTYTYEPGCMYRRNGDPGDPPYEEIGIDNIHVEGVVNADTGEPVEDKDIINAIKDDVYYYLSDSIDAWNKPEEPEECED